MNRTTAFVGIWLLLAVPIAAQPKCTFPGKANICRSPNRQWALHWQEASGSSPHALVAERVATHRSSKLLTFNRSVDVLWSPDSTYIAITDRSGSTDSTVLVAELRSGSVRNVEDDLHDALKSLPWFYANGHRYLNALRWQTKTKLVFEVRAYDAGPRTEVRRTFTFDVKSRTVKQTD